jgi:hypothetical protein
MNTYDVYFEIYGKKLKVKLKAKSKIQAEEIVKSKIIFHKIKDVTMEDVFGKTFKDIFK